MLEKGEGWNRKFPFRVGFCADRCSRHIPGPSRLFFLFLSFFCLCTSLSGLAGLCGRTPSKYSLEEHLWAGVEILWKKLAMFWSIAFQSRWPAERAWDIVSHNIDIHDIHQARHIRRNEIILKGLIHTTAPKTMACVLCVLARTHQMRHLMSTRYLLSKGVKTTRERKEKLKRRK